MQFNMIARIDFAEQHNGKFYTVVTTPAPDAFSHPARFKLQSPQQISQVGQSIECTVSVSGVVREKPYMDKLTKMQRIFQEADVFLNVVSWKPVSQQPAKS